MAIDLSAASVVDAHCHGFRVEDLLDAPGSWTERITLLGMCMASSVTAPDSLKAQTSALTESTVFGLLGRRWLAGWLDVPEAEVEETRARRLRDDATSYLSALMADQGIARLLVDDGYPQPPVDGAELASLIGIETSRVARIEPIIDRVMTYSESVSDVLETFGDELDRCGADPTCVGYKSVIAYRSGLDVGDPDDDEVASSFESWKAGGSGRAATKSLRDRFLHLTCRKAASQDKAVHIHSGAGDPDVVLAHAHPTGLAPLIAANPETAIVLIHAGFPWIEEAAYLAGMYANAHVELSLLNPWGTMDLERGLRTVLGLVPVAKVMYGSDEASEPEVLWIAARVFRRALEGVLTSAVDDDFLTPSQAMVMGEGILGQNALQLHGLPPS